MGEALPEGLLVQQNAEDEKRVPGEGRKAGKVTPVEGVITLYSNPDPFLCSHRYDPEPKSRKFEQVYLTIMT